MKKLTTKEFIERAIKIHSSKYDHELTEYQNCLNNRYDRIWDCGKIKYELI